MSTLPAPLRRQLERAVQDARNISTIGAQKSLEAFAVHGPDPYRHMNEAQRTHRRKLRAQAKQLGDGESQTKRGAYEIKHLVEKLAYDQWHRLLFARFLLENNLLISPEHSVSVSLNDCEELAPSLGLKDAWAVAARFAAVELPEIFRADDPAGGVELPVEDRKGLIQLVTGLPVEVFPASDSLGWCYQFWQAERKDQVNAAGNKIGADELPSVTQLFTEDYMVDFLLDNTLGAWHAGKKAEGSRLKFATEEEARQAVSLPGCPWKYLRFVKVPSDGEAADSTSAFSWLPAAGTFDGWPKTAKELKCLDPCMGSGHFVVAMFERLVALRMAEEKLDEAAAVSAVIRDNLFGLEIDPRCTQIGAFNLALAAWRRVGHCKLPAMNLACSGLGPNAKLEDWLKLADSQPSTLNSQPSDRLRSGMERLYQLFKQAPVLGSLINPRASEGDLLVAAFHELQPLLEKALAQETKDDTAHEMAVTARGLAKAAEILAGQFTLVATNVPYLLRRKQTDEVKEFCVRTAPEAKSDLATVFVVRCLNACVNGGAAALVTPQTWMSQDYHQGFRKEMLTRFEWHLHSILGSGAFETITGEIVKPALSVFGNSRPGAKDGFASLDASAENTLGGKADALRNKQLLTLRQADQVKNPESRIILTEPSKLPRLEDLASYNYGICTGDKLRFLRCFWEMSTFGKEWSAQKTTVKDTTHHGGMHEILLWESGNGSLLSFVKDRLGPTGTGAWIRGAEAWGKSGVIVSAMGSLPVSLYHGELFDENSDRGRNEGLNLAPPSKPDRRVSRIRLSSGWFLTLEIGSLVFGLRLRRLAPSA